MICLGRALLVVGLCLSAASCGPALKGPEPVNGPEPGFLDLRTRNFNSESPVVPQGWLWDLGVLWSPASGGRPGSLAPSQPLGALDLGKGFGTQGLPSPGHPLAATAWLSVSVDDRTPYGFQVGAFPGADRVWVNGILVWETGVLSPDPRVFQPGGAGTVMTLQPQNGNLTVVVEMVTDDPLVLHSEMNRLWVLGPGTQMVAVQGDERSFRLLQTVVLILGILVFLWIASLRRGRRNLLYFVWFLAACALKLVVNVEQPQPLLEPYIGGIPLSWYLFLNHGLNLVPFPLLVLFLAKQFPEDIGFKSVTAIFILTGLVEIWELLPFILLAAGSFQGYETVMRGPWTFILNLYVVLATLFVFERFYHLFSKKRPLSGALFVGGIFIGLIILIPVPLSYFLPVRYTYFFGWGLFLFLVTLIFSFVRHLIRSSDADLLNLKFQFDRGQTLGRFINPGWAHLLGRASSSDIRPGDRRRAEAVFVQVTSDSDPENWLPVLGPLAASRRALLVSWTEGTGIWALEAWSEAALAFALEVHRTLGNRSGLLFKVVVARAPGDFRILDAGTQWVPAVTGIPWWRLAELRSMAERTGATVVLDTALQDGLVIGGWRRHRHLTLSGREIELYEGEEETLAQLKDLNLDAFEGALTLARAGRFDEGALALVELIHRNPFDQPARTLLTDWRNTHNP